MVRISTGIKLVNDFGRMKAVAGLRQAAVQFEGIIPQG
jgi:hypothetical protein